MKYIKTYKIFENSNSDLELLLNKYYIQNYTINDDGSIDVNGNVNLFSRGIKEIPFKFRKIKDSFFFAYNKLTSLEGCPIEVGSNFNCSFNQLTSLKGCPSEVYGNFQCDHNQLESLEYCASEIGGYFSCSDNKLTSLEYCPSEIGGNFACSHNQLTMLDCSSYVKGNIYCYDMFTEEPEFFGDCEGKIKWK